jgi:hypothetical protein
VIFVTFVIFVPQPSAVSVCPAPASEFRLKAETTGKQKAL